MATYTQKIISLTAAEEIKLNLIRKKGIKIIDIFRAGMKYYLRKLI